MAVEAALIAPILIAMCLGVIEFGHHFYIQHSIKSAAQLGARRGSLPAATEANVRAAVIDALSGLVEVEDADIDVDYEDQTAGSGTVHVVRVTVRGTSGIIGPARTLQAESVMQMEQ